MTTDNFFTWGHKNIYFFNFTCIHTDLAYIKVNLVPHPPYLL